MQEAHAGEKYNFEVVRWFTIAAVVYLVVGALLGVIIASQLTWPVLNLDIPYFTFGRLRPLHANAVIFAFGGSTLMAASHYIVQRTCSVRIWSDKLAWFTFIGWNLIIVSAVITLPLLSPWALRKERNMPSLSGPSTLQSPWYGSSIP